MKSKKMCKLVMQDFHLDHPSEYRKLITKSRYYCEKCGRPAPKKKMVCGPIKFESQKR